MTRAINSRQDDMSDASNKHVIPRSIHIVSNSYPKDDIDSVRKPRIYEYACKK